MFTKRTILSLVLLICLGLAACSPMATMAPAEAPQPEAYQEMQSPNDAAYDYVFFENYGVNPFIDTEDDNLSTFALDVDTGAYTVMRRYVTDGNLPEADSVRVEEYVNYFDLGYAYPTNSQAFDISIDGAPTPYGQTERYEQLRIGIQGYSVPPESRKDVSLTFVIDVSGSMDMESRLELVKQSLAVLVEQLRPTDLVSIVVYGTTARTVLKPTSGENKDVILRVIKKLNPEGVTNAEDGIRLGYKMAAEAFNPNGINRVILCSDGVANVGNTGADSIWAQVEESASKGITLTTVGFGMGNYNDVLMEQLADKGDGFYTYVDDIKEAERIFVKNLTSTLQVIAMDAKVQVDFDPTVVARYRLIGYENRALKDDEFRDDTVDAGEIGAGLSITALYEIKLQPYAVGRIATVYLRWKEPETGNAQEISKDFNTYEMASVYESASPYFQWVVTVAEYADVLRKSYWAEGSTLTGICSEVQRILPMLPIDDDKTEFADLACKASAMSGE